MSLREMVVAWLEAKGYPHSDAEFCAPLALRELRRGKWKTASEDQQRALLMAALRRLA